MRLFSKKNTHPHPYAECRQESKIIAIVSLTATCDTNLLFLLLRSISVSLDIRTPTVY